MIATGYLCDFSCQKKCLPWNDRRIQSGRKMFFIFSGGSFSGNKKVITGWGIFLGQVILPAESERDLIFFSTPSTSKIPMSFYFAPSQHGFLKHCLPLQGFRRVCPGPALPVLFQCFHFQFLWFSSIGAIKSG